MIKMTNKEAIKIIQMERDHCALHNQDAGKDEEYHKEMQSLVDAFDLAIKALEDKPQGEWVNTSPHDDKGECSFCCYLSNKYYNFCPNCGAKMKKGSEDEKRNT